VSAGRIFLDEIHEQPAALRALLAAEDELERIGRRISERRRLVRLVAHGSSDNAAAFGVYAFGLLAGWNAMRDSISLSVYYRAELPFEDSLVIALSQSGRTPDVLAYVERARSRGALTLALTNDERSPLAQAAELVLPLRAGPERAVAATKTYTNQLAALALLAAHPAGRGRELTGMLSSVADLAEQELPRLAREAGRLAVPFAFVGRMVVIGRGFEYATAREVALKLTETCRVAAEALTSTDLVHGPVAALDRLFPVWAIASDEVSLPTVEAAVARAREAGALVVASGSAAERLAGAEHVLATPPAGLPMLAPILSVLPGQLFASALARAKGLDPDEPEHLSKVTLAP
jgi:glucosamine--fructose-6-phosphate aminotransferase (isomerizing)